MAAENQSADPPTPETAALPSETQQHVVAPTLRPRRGKNFLLFPKLAYELQEMIFKFVAEDLDPNIVKIYLSNPEDDPTNTQPEIRASYKVPALLKVNHQAREVAVWESGYLWRLAQLLLRRRHRHMRRHTRKHGDRCRYRYRHRHRCSTYPETSPIHDITPG